MKRKIKQKLVSVLMVIALSVCMINESVTRAATVKTDGYLNIDPSYDDFKLAAAGKKYNSKNQAIKGNIRNPYALDIYHYEAQESGWYTFYTTGKTDTIGRLYEEEGIIKKKYVDRGSSWGANIDPTGDNFKINCYVNKYEDYYICVRAKQDKTGAYILKIEPNEDKTTYKNYGVWTAENVPTSAVIARYWVRQKTYLSKEQAIIYYWMLDPATQIKNGSKSYTMSSLRKKFKNNGAETVRTILETAVITAVGCVNTEVGVGLTALQVLFSLAEDSSASTKETVKEKLVKQCGVRHIADAKTFKGSWTAKNGLLISEYYNGNSLKTCEIYYEKFTGTELKGEKWYNGGWRF